MIMRKHRAAAMLILIMTAAPSFAQRVTMRPSISSGFAPTSHERIPRAIFLGAPFWGDDYYGHDSMAPSVIVVQSPAPAASPSRAIQDEPKPAEPLVIEWQGDRYVRRTGEAHAGVQDARVSKKVSAVPLKPALVQTNPEPIARAEAGPSIFVFRDGHQEQSSDYTIVSGVIYARGDYWTSGSWTKKIPIAQLDVPATLRANTEKGVPFRLPGAPNEIITRP